MPGIDARPEPVEAAVSRLRPGDTVLLNGAASFPMRFAEALVASELERITIIHPMRRAPFALDPDYIDAALADRFAHVSEFTFDREIREAIHAGRAVYRPNHPHEAAATLAQAHGGYTFVSSASPPDEHGWFSLGAFGGWGIAWARTPKTERIILEVNPNQPRVHGSVSVHVSEVDCFYEADYPLTSDALSSEPTAVDLALADNVVELIPDEATLQIGAGAVSDQVAKRLLTGGRRHLGIHSEGLFDSMVELIEAGVVDNSRKAVDRGRTVFALSLGSARLFRFLDDNPGLDMRSMTSVNDPALIARNRKQVAVNAAVQVDLMGQVSSESIGPVHYSGVGGQWEFLYGAGHSPGGRPITLLASTTRKGLSTIVSGFPPGTPVTVPRNDVGYVVTEHGVANLRGRTLRQRALELIAVAHPDHRDRLRAEARDAQLI
ncbi:MAG TPA: acetyl-CoA hydrolase/transferase C-terminal domain-containing protein [Solirubrobacter sp.]|nr:acetyl-CoA hydrolase/transferase C-terminal domain-containing protein [Solirubrobacter sp.]